jgi:hypothetical protein
MHHHRVVDLAVNSTLDIKWIGDALLRTRDDLPRQYVDSLEALITRLKGFVSLAHTSPHDVDANAFQQAKEELDRSSVAMHEKSISKSLGSMPTSVATPMSTANTTRKT